MGYFFRTCAYFRSRIEPALFPMAKREPSQMQADAAPKSGCLDHDEPIGNAGLASWLESTYKRTDNLCLESLLKTRICPDSCE